MHSALPLSLTLLIAVGVIFNGAFYLVRPNSASRSFGLPLPAADPATNAWLRLKGIRDVASGVVILTLIHFADRHLLGIVFIAYSIIPLGDMLIVLGSGGSKTSAFSIHGLTCAVMLLVGLLFIHAI